MRRGAQAAVLVWGMLLGTGVCRGVVLDWSLVSWTPRALTGSLDIDPNNPGNDIQITITGDTSYLNGNNPQIDTALTGGFGSGTQSFDLTPTFNNISQSFTVTVAFLYSSGVNGVNFTMFDVDSGGGGSPPVDQVRNIYATATGSTNLVAPNITGSIDNVVAGTGVNQTITGVDAAANSSGDGNATVSYGSNYVDQFTFTFGNAPNSGSGKQPSQHFALFDISYNPRPVPEQKTAWGALAVCALAVSCSTLRSRRKRLFDGSP